MPGDTELRIKAVGEGFPQVAQQIRDVAKAQSEVATGGSAAVAGGAFAPLGESADKAKIAVDEVNRSVERLVTAAAPLAGSSARELSHFARALKAVAESGAGAWAVLTGIGKTVGSLFVIGAVVTLIEAFVGKLVEMWHASEKAAEALRDQRKALAEFHDEQSRAKQDIEIERIRAKRPPLTAAQLSEAERKQRDIADILGPSVSKANIIRALSALGPEASLEDIATAAIGFEAETLKVKAGSTREEQKTRAFLESPRSSRERDIARQRIQEQADEWELALQRSLLNVDQPFNQRQIADIAKRWGLNPEEVEKSQQSLMKKRREEWEFFRNIPNPPDVGPAYFPHRQVGAEKAIREEILRLLEPRTDRPVTINQNNVRNYGSDSASRRRRTTNGESHAWGSELLPVEPYY